MKGCGFHFARHAAVFNQDDPSWHLVTKRMNLPYLLTLALVLFRFLGSEATAQIISTFDSDREGWVIVDVIQTDALPVSTNTPVYSATNGNPAGFIRQNDPNDGQWSFFQAPALFLGSRSNYYGGSLSFDVRRRGGTLSSFADVILVGAGMTLVVDAGSGPAEDEWTNYTVPLDVSAAWRLGSLTGAPPSEVEFTAVLGSLEAVRIRGEYSNAVNNDRGDLDNVVLSPCNADIRPTIRKSAAQVSEVEICWDSRASSWYQVQYRSAADYKLLEQPPGHERNWHGSFHVCFRSYATRRNTKILSSHLFGPVRMNVCPGFTLQRQ